MVARELPDGHPRLQPESRFLLPAAPTLRQAILDNDQEHLKAMKEAPVGTQSQHLEQLRAQVAQAQAEAEMAGQ